MKILVYCQHVLGLGHYFRTLEICRAFDRHEVVIIAGGPPIDAPLPDHVREIRLPQLRMDRQFSGLLTDKGDLSVAQVKKNRRQTLFGLYKQEAPDVLFIELYPFGRRAFSFEIDPLLKGIHKNILKSSMVICSLRDILVDRKKYQTSYESKVLALLNQYFDALLVHADPLLLKLDKTFKRAKDISIPIVYTGFVTPAPRPDARTVLRKRLKLDKSDKLILASLGGGKVGEALLPAVITAFQEMAVSKQDRLCVFTGPFMKQTEFERIKRFSNEHVQVERFTSEFISYLAAADLSVSMAGYNTCMNILSSRVPALVWPFSQNWEQRMRADRLAEMGALKVLEDKDLEPMRLAARMEKMLSQPQPSTHPIDLAGAANTALWLQEWVGGKIRGQDSGVGGREKT